ncbi:MAG: hypothetical protein IPL27_15055 [Lewinellaceae bacterium]|nr:hypothetical protein [Lewinellaceae bacterium]
MAGKFLEITEPAIYYNAGYIPLLSNFVENAVVPAIEPADFPVVLFEVFPESRKGSMHHSFSEAGFRKVQIFNAAVGRFRKTGH